MHRLSIMDDSSSFKRMVRARTASWKRMPGNSSWEMGQQSGESSRSDTVGKPGCVVFWSCFCFPVYLHWVILAWIFQSSFDSDVGIYLTGWSFAPVPEFEHRIKSWFLLKLKIKILPFSPPWRNWNILRAFWLRQFFSFQIWAYYALLLHLRLRLDIYFSVVGWPATVAARYRSCTI